MIACIKYDITLLDCFNPQIDVCVCNTLCKVYKRNYFCQLAKMHLEMLRTLCGGLILILA